jgi:hypothetical protein
MNFANPCFGVIVLLTGVTINGLAVMLPGMIRQAPKSWASIIASA